MLYGALASACCSSSAPPRMWEHRRRRARLVRAAGGRDRVRAVRDLPLLAHLLTGGPARFAPPILGWHGGHRGSDRQRDAKASIAEQRRALPDQPGVYLFRDGRGRVVYVGKAKSRAQARGVALLQGPGAEQPRPRRDGGERGAHRVRRRGHRGRGAAGRAELHQAVPAALQHPPARRQVLPVHRDLPGRGVSRACTSRASATAPGGRTSARTRTPSACGARSRCSRRCSCSAPAPARSRGGAAAARAWTTTSSAARRRAWGTSPRRTTGAASTA